MAAKEKLRAQKRESTYVRDVVGVAAVFGVRIYDQRARKQAQLDAVRGAMGRPDFPRKVSPPGFWPRAAVCAWARRFVVVGEDGRAFVLNAAVEDGHSEEDGRLRIEDGKAEGRGPIADSKTEKAEVGDARQRIPTGDQTAGDRANPVGQNGPGDSPALDQAEFEANLARFSPHYQRRYTELYELWLNPNPAVPGKTLTNAQHQELIDAGFVKKPLALAGATDVIGGGVRGVAGYIMNHFPGVIVNHMDVQRWLHGEYLPEGCTEHFPPPEASGSGRFRKSAVNPWVQRYLVRSAVAQGLPGVGVNIDYEREQKRLNFERSQQEFAVWKQANSDKYMAVSVHEATCAGIGSVVRNSVRELIERLLPARLIAELGVRAGLAIGETFNIQPPWNGAGNSTLIDGRGVCGGWPSCEGTKEDGRWRIEDGTAPASGKPATFNFQPATLQRVGRELFDAWQVDIGVRMQNLTEEAGKAGK